MRLSLLLVLLAVPLVAAEGYYVPLDAGNVTLNASALVREPIILGEPVVWRQQAALTTWEAPLFVNRRRPVLPSRDAVQSESEAASTPVLILPLASPKPSCAIASCDLREPRCHRPPTVVPRCRTTAATAAMRSVVSRAHRLELATTSSRYDTGLRPACPGAAAERGRTGRRPRSRVWARRR